MKKKNGGQKASLLKDAFVVLMIIFAVQFIL